MPNTTPNKNQHDQEPTRANKKPQTEQERKDQERKDKDADKKRK